MEHKKRKKKTKKMKKAKIAKITIMVKIAVIILPVVLFLGFILSTLINTGVDIKAASSLFVHSENNELKKKNEDDYNDKEKIEENTEEKNEVIVDSTSNKSKYSSISSASEAPGSNIREENSPKNDSDTIEDGKKNNVVETPWSSQNQTSGENKTDTKVESETNKANTDKDVNKPNNVEDGKDNKPENGNNAKEDSSNSSKEDVQKEETKVSNNLDLKTVEYFYLYEKGRKIESVDISKGVPQNVGDYYIEIKANSLPVFYADVKEFQRSGESLYVVPDIDDFVQYSYVPLSSVLEKTDGLRFEIPFMENGSSNGLKSANELFQQMKADPTKEYELTENLDASSLTGNFGIPGNFTGTLKGNGYTIYNLQVPLFENIVGGRVENLTINNAGVSNQNGILAKTISSGGTVDRVNIESSFITSPNLSLVGGFVGTLDNGKITNSSFVDSSVEANNTLGAIAGQINASGTVENCLVEAVLTGALYHGTLGTRIGGVTGWHTGTIDRCYVDVQINAKSMHGSGGLIGGPNGARGNITNSFCLVKGNVYQVAGFDAALGGAKNIYVSPSSTAKANTSSNIRSSVATKELLVDTLGMNRSIWEYAQASASLLTQSDLIKYVTGYNRANDTRYANVVKLAPFLNIEDIVKYGNALTHTNLTSKTIKSVIPYDLEKNLVMYLNVNNTNAVSKITVIYTDNTFDNFNVAFTNLSGANVAISNITELGIPYHFNKFVIGDISELKSYILSKAASWDYNTDIAITTQEEEARQYAENYRIFVKDDLDAFAEKLISTEYSYYGENKYILDKIKGDLDSRLNKILYTYNYFSKWYNFEVGKINVTDLIFFESELLSPDLTMDYIISSLYSGNRGTNQAYNHYNATIKTKTGLELYSQLELLMDIAGYTDYNQWFDDNFSGILKEQNVIGYTPETELKYRIWDNMKKLTGVDAHLLHVLTIPEEEQKDIILLSVPSQLMISSVNVYHQEANDTTRSQTASAFENYAIRVGKYYGTSLGFVENGESNLNRDIFINYDTILGFRSLKYPGRQLKGSEEPMVKWIFEPQGRLYSGNAGAVANGKYTYYGYQAMLVNLGLFSHENAHNQDSKYFYNNAGRRSGSGGEHHCEGVLTLPEYIDGCIAFNLTREYNFTDYVVTNLTTERINSKEEIQDFYGDIFDSWYVINSMYANAFIESSPTIQSNVSKKVNEYRLGDGDETDVSSPTQYGYGYWEDEFVNLNIQTFEQLYDAKVAVRPIDNVASGYYTEDFWAVNWYEPSNPNGIADPGSFKRMGQELLGYAGYDEGFVTWMSMRSDNDDDAIQKITGYSNMREYKLARYNEALNKLPSIPYFDHEQIEEVIKSAYATENRSSTANSLAIKQILYSTVKRVTSDFTDGNIYEPSGTMFKVGTAQELIDIVNGNCKTKGVHITLTNDIDFSDVSTSGSAYCDIFIGFLDGGSYTISGLSKPLFNEIRFGVVSNVVFEGETKTLVANKGSYSLIHHVNKADDAVFIKQTLKDTFNAEYEINSIIVQEVSQTLSLEPVVLENSTSGNNLSISENDAAAALKESGGDESKNQKSEETVEKENVVKDEDNSLPEDKEDVTGSDSSNETASKTEGLNGESSVIDTNSSE